MFMCQLSKYPELSNNTSFPTKTLLKCMTSDLTGFLFNYWIFPVGQLVSPILCLRLTLSMLVLVHIVITITTITIFTLVLCPALQCRHHARLAREGRYLCVVSAAWAACIPPSSLPPRCGSP